MLLEFSSKRILNSAVTSGGKELYHIHTQTHFGMARTLTVIRRSGDDKSVAVIEWKEHQISIAAGGNVTKASLAQLHSMQSTHAGEMWVDCEKRYLAYGMAQHPPLAAQRQVLPHRVCSPRE